MLIVEYWWEIGPVNEKGTKNNRTHWKSGHWENTEIID